MKLLKQNNITDQWLKPDQVRPSADIRDFPALFTKAVKVRVSL